MSESDLERLFAYWWRLLAGGEPEPEREYLFQPGRRWRFDFAFCPPRVAVECEGGVYVGGRHVRPAGFELDAEKYNAAALAGWAVLRFTGTMLERDPARCVAQVRQLLAQRSGAQP